MNTSEKIQLLRQTMQEQNIRACIIPSTDPHISEYTPNCWKTREWISGFTGSAGTIAVTSDKAGLWTDSRYFLQAEEQLKGSGIDLFKSGLPGTPPLKEWLAEELNEEDRIGIEGEVFPASEVRELTAYFSDKNIVICTDFTPYNELWKDRPGIPSGKIFILPESFSGAGAGTKINEVLQAIREEEADLTILGSLDMTAWLFNLRGNDVDFNPVAVCYAIVSSLETVLFIHPEKLTQEASESLRKEGVILADYEKIIPYIQQIPAGKNVLVNPGKINNRIYKAIPEECTIIESAVHPVDRLKSIKNETEITGFKKAMQRDGVALVRFLIWLEKSLAAGEPVSELDVSRKLREFRSEQDFFFGESFGTIAGYAAHGAIVHYGATEDSNAVVQNQGVLLIDSGAQYFDGTTDITRTIAPGPVSDTIKSDYTRVLKGHIALARARFPEGTKGIQLDILARQFLWENGCNYLHGTGHGIGHFLNVHEGPQSIRMEFNPVELQPGMITSNEPGVYRAGSHGIRIENLILTIKDKTTDWGNFYAFETLTLCPIDKKPIDKSLMTEQEINWLNTYHQQVYELLSPSLTEEEKTWLKLQTNEL